MNQILLTENYKKDKKPNRNNSGDMKKIIIFFSIAICVFALVIVGVYGYKLYNNSNKNKKEKTVEKPQISLEETEDSVTIIAKAEAGISKIIYTWNEEEPIEIDMNGRKSHEEQMDIPFGENKLNVKIIDENGDEIESTKEFIKISTQKPIIEVEVVDQDKLQIIATDETAIQYITYKWNDEEPTIIEAQSETDTVIETKIDLKIGGTNTITITAVDSDNNEEVFTEPFLVKRKPAIEVSIQGEEIYMKITHDKGFEKVEFSVNGKIYKYNEDFEGYDPEKKKLEYKIKLKEGENTVIILAVSTEGTEKIYKGKYDYTPEQ